MKLALISLSKDAPGDFGSIGLLPLFDGLLVDQQIQSVRIAGAEKIILISPTMNSTVLQYVDNLQGQGVDIEIVRSGHDLVQFAAPENEMIFLGDGILPAKKLFEQLAGVEDELIFVAPDSEQVTDFERIDRSDRWLGIAKLNASRLSNFIDLPEDWDVGSALLRGAVQSECRRETVEESDLSHGAISILTNEGDVSNFSQKHLQDVPGDRRNFLEKFVAWPLTRAILPGLWKTPAVHRYVGWGAPITAILAIGTAFLNLPIAVSIGLLIAGMMFLYVRKNIEILSNSSKSLDVLAIATYCIAITALFFLIVRDSIPVSLPANLVVLALGLGAVHLAHQNNKKSKWDLVQPDNGLLLTILLGFSVFGSFVIGIYAIALLTMVYLLARRFD